MDWLYNYRLQRQMHISGYSGCAYQSVAEILEQTIKRRLAWRQKTLLTDRAENGVSVAALERSAQPAPHRAKHL